jgi:hypothetical protein
MLRRKGRTKEVFHGQRLNKRLANPKSPENVNVPEAWST